MSTAIDLSWASIHLEGNTSKTCLPIPPMKDGFANLPLFKANLCPLTFLDVPEVAYERSTQAYLAIKQDLTEPDPLRLANKPASRP